MTAPTHLPRAARPHRADGAIGESRPCWFWRAQARRSGETAASAATAAVDGDLIVLTSSVTGSQDWRIADIASVSHQFCRTTMEHR